MRLLVIVAVLASLPVWSSAADGEGSINVLYTRNEVRGADPVEIVFGVPKVETTKSLWCIHPKKTGLSARDAILLLAQAKGQTLVIERVDSKDSNLIWFRVNP